MSLENFVSNHNDIRKDGLECVALILEDDAILPHDSAARNLVNEFETLSIDRWDMINLEGTGICNGKGRWPSEGMNLFLPEQVSDTYLKVRFGGWSGAYAGAYAVTLQGAKKILKKIPVTSNIDTWYNSLAFWGHITQLLRCPGLIIQGSTDRWKRIYNVESLVAREGPKNDKGVWINPNDDLQEVTNNNL
eukprot:CAMPEP_0167756980 /NCGR_PEP_ID=MMETSP0110_2-20121227/9680_1 /TAXON_ID=629695 /ORGANISM="Gymnochlora sp., Strain CCMP2014" /LENGTH=190 /DNA_ID=CAMNT_0007643137 /DNA_START=1060 /DNA_END=1632 /DNA_ORIENTATION=+